MADDERASQPEISSLGSPNSPLNSTENIVFQEKLSKILDACLKQNVAELQWLATSPGGFLTDALRRQAWPILLGCTSQTMPRNGNINDEDIDESPKLSFDQEDDQDHSEYASWQHLPRHREEDQVQLDVDRSFIYYPTNISDSKLSLEKAALSDAITEVLRRHPYLSYFQGYHDICTVFLLVLPGAQRCEALARLSILRIRDFMLPTMVPFLNLLRLVPEILTKADPELARHLGILPSSTLRDQGSPFFFLAALARGDENSEDGYIHLSAVQATLTMYAHDVESFTDICRLFDALLAYEPVFALYVFVQMVRTRRDDLLETALDEPDMMQFKIQKVTKQHLDMDEVVAASAELFHTCPPSSLTGWKAVSRFSVMKTGRNGVHEQSLAFGRTCFDAQVQEMRKIESRKTQLKKLQRYRKPVLNTFRMAILVGIVAILLKKDLSITGWLIKLFGSRK